METRLTLRPGQPGTRKLPAHYGERLLRVSFLYDARESRRLKTVELIVESVPWRPGPWRLRRRDEDIVAMLHRSSHTLARRRINAIRYAFVD